MPPEEARGGILFGAKTSSNVHTHTPLTGTSTNTAIRAASKDVAKLAEFLGNKGFSSPDDAETWLRIVARAIKINKWSADDTFAHVQGKRVSSAAFFFSPRGHLPDSTWESGVRPFSPGGHGLPPRLHTMEWAMNSC